uniref:Uncharacterized protein n=1 Tax=Oryza sativa subsp. japonica TaxID=39947 RepID=Q69JI8_ORYSJ|nr:hypothetical protein [Oryza sativa Japonica Group]
MPPGNPAADRAVASLSVFQISRQAQCERPPHQCTTVGTVVVVLVVHSSGAARAGPSLEEGRR